MIALLGSAPVEAAHAPDPTLVPALAALDDAALVAHFRRRRGVHVDPVIDPDETHPERIDAIVDGRFTFNGETHELGAHPDWRHNPSVDVEWHILLHKFYYAVGLALAWQRSGDLRYVRRWEQLIDGWLRQRIEAGFIAADVTGRRVQNWIYSLQILLCDGGTAPLSAALLRRLLHTLHEQVEYLCAHLTPKRNHRTLELLAIHLAGTALPELRDAARWRELALRETLRNIEADLLPDGVHCELSTDYHHLALRNWLQVRQLAARNGQAVPPAMDAALERALAFALHVHKPDGVVPSLSDGDARCWLPLLEQGAALYGRADMRFVASGGTHGAPPARRVARFADAGYHVVRSGWPRAPQFAQAQYLVFDCGPLGEGNHGHFDALSFELAAHGRSLVVDPGRYTYSEAGTPNWRVHFRGTAAHNTVCIDDRPQTRYEPRPVKGASRHGTGTLRHKVVGPAPSTALLEALASPRLDLLHGRAVGADTDAVHERLIVFIDRCYWLVSDRLHATGEHDYQVNFQLHALAQDRCRLHDTRLDSPGLQVAWPGDDGTRHRIEPGWVSARYGHKDAAPRLLATRRAADASFDHLLLPCPDAQARLAVQRVPAGVLRQALRIESSLRPGCDLWFHAGTTAVDGIDLAGVRGQARWLHLQLDADGRLLRAASHAGARLQAAVAVELLSDEGAAP